MRSLVPADALVYLESNDLAAALQPIIDSKPFTEVAKTKPDFSALKGVQLAVAVTGFETSEEKVNDEQSIGRIQPRFVAIADTHAWNFQTVGFAEQKLTSFVEKIYDQSPTLEKSEKNGGKYFTWTAANRKAYALVIDSLIYFANDESAIEKCLAVKRNEADSILKTNKLQPSDPQTLASGYISSDGIAQIAIIIALKFASEAAEDSEIQSAIAGIVPQVLRKSITDVTWIAKKTDQGIEDKYLIRMPTDVADVLSKTLGIQNESEAISFQNNAIIAQLPVNVQVATRYNLKDPQLAWQSILLVLHKNTVGLDGRILTEFGSLLFEPYGIRDPELFLSSVGDKPNMSRNIVTATLDEQADESFVIASRGDDTATRKSLAPEFKPPSQIVEGDVNIWSDGDTQVAFDQDMIKIGPKEDLGKFNGMRLGELSDIRSDLLRRLATSKAPVTTIGRDTTTALALREMLTRETTNGGAKTVSTYVTETYFTETRMERHTVSDFGLIGSIIAQLGQD